MIWVRCMGANSIRVNLSKSDIIADIRMTLAADFEHKKSILVVEGTDDLTFFRGKLSPDVEIYESFSGKSGVAEIVNAFSDKPVIGICDRDYEGAPPCERMFYYDFCCLEMMLAACPEAFASLAHTYYRGALAPEELLLRILQQLKWLSELRQANDKNGWGIRFSGLSFFTAFNRAQEIDRANLLAQMQAQNPHLAILFNTDFLSSLERACAVPDDSAYLLRITQGHDFLYCFQAYCHFVDPRATHQPDSHQLFHSLVCAYRKTDFQRTELYCALCHYEKTHAIHVLAF